MEKQVEQLIAKYLDDVEQELRGVSPSARRDFITEIRSHILSQWEDAPEKTPAIMMNILDSFGDAREIAAELRGKNEVQTTSLPYPNWLVVMLTILIWPLGIVLAWLSPAWRRRDKLIATIVPVVAFILVVLASVTSYTEGTVYTETMEISETVNLETGEVRQFPANNVTQARQQKASILGYVLYFSMIALGNPLFSGIYLAATPQAVSSDS